MLEVLSSEDRNKAEIFRKIWGGVLDPGLSFVDPLKFWTKIEVNPNGEYQEALNFALNRLEEGSEKFIEELLYSFEKAKERLETRKASQQTGFQEPILERDLSLDFINERIKEIISVQGKSLAEQFPVVMKTYRMMNPLFAADTED